MTEQNKIDKILKRIEGIMPECAPPMYNLLRDIEIQLLADKKALELINAAPYYTGSHPEGFLKRYNHHLDLAKTALGIKE